MASADVIGGGNIEPRALEEEMRTAYLDYAMSVIVGRALPDVRDGLKPVHRRVLYAMNELGLGPTRSYAKCAKIVGEVMGNYHPHGDSAIYDTLVRMAQDFSMRNELVDGQGNFGSLDDDPAAAMRYCVAGDTRVRTSTGTVRIDSLVSGALPNSDNTVDIEVCDRLGRPVHASLLFHSGEHPSLRLTTVEGYELTGTANHPVLCLLDMAGVPLLMWKLLEEIGPGERVLLSRNASMVDQPLEARSRMLAVLAGAFVSEGWFGERRAGFNNIDKDFFDVVIGAYDEIVGGARYVNSRTIRSGSLCHELDIQNLAALRASPLAELEGLTSERKRVPEFVWSGQRRIQACLPPSAVRGRRLLFTPPSQHDPDLLFDPQSAICAGEVQQLLLEFGVISRLSHSARGEIKVVITNRRDARLFAERVGFLGAKQPKLDRALARISGQEPRAEPRPHPAYRWLHSLRRRLDIRRARLARRHNVDRIERWEQASTAILERISSAGGTRCRLAARQRRLLLRRGRIGRARRRTARLLTSRRQRRSLIPDQRLRQPQHRGSPRAHRHRDAARPRHGHGRLRAQLRRLAPRTAGPALALPQPARQRLLGHRRRNGHQHPPAQPARGDRRHDRLHRRPGDRHRRADAPHQGTGLPDRGDHPRPRGHQGCLRDRSRARARAGARAHRAAQPRQGGDRRHRAAVYGQEGRRGQPHDQDRGAGQRQTHPRDLRPHRPVGQARHAPGDRAQARRDPEGGAQQALQAHAHADHVRREHGRARRQRPAHAEPAGGDPQLRRPPARGDRAPHQARALREGGPRPHPRGAADGARAPRRDHRADPRLARPRQPRASSSSPASSSARSRRPRSSTCVSPS